MLSEFLKARLSRRIVLWIFLSIVVIEAVILVPSVYRRERELLAYLRSLSAAQATGILNTQELTQLNSQQLLQYLTQLQRNEVVRGGALYTQAGELVGVFGEPPALPMAQVFAQGDRYWRAENKYDAVWAMSPLDGRYILVIRHDATWVRREFFAFIGRIIGLVVIISLFVTGATMVGLERMVIQPVIRLRRDLLKAGAAIQEDCDTRTLIFESRSDCRQDELGEVIMAFDRMFSQITAAIATRKESEIRFRTLVEQAADAFFVVNQDQQIIDINQQACESLGYRRPELLTLKMSDIQPTLTTEAFTQLWATLKPGVPQNQEGFHRRKDGSTFPVEVRIGLLKLGQQPLLLALARDVTERKQAERMTAQLAEVGELAAMIVHEVRSPLTTVLMGLQSFQNLELSERSKIRLNLALEEAERLQKLLNEILLFARQQVADLQPMEVAPFVQELAATVQSMPLAMNRLIHVIPSPEPLHILGDRDKLKQVFINLLCNACEAVPTGETITWQFHSPNASQVALQVHNGGTPIPEELLPKLTQPFFTTKTTGNGLGLAITQRIVEAHQGELRIQSSERSGTVVTVILPRLR